MINRKLGEQDVAKAALFILKQKYPDTIHTSDLRREIIRMLRPSGENLKILSGRSDEKITQIVRNLKSHKDNRTNIIGMGHAVCTEDGYWSITREGIQHIESYIENLIVDDIR